MSQLVQEKIGPFDCLVKGDSSCEYTIVLFHGYGADSADLASLYQIMDHESVRWIFPNGPLEVPIGPMWMGRAWFEIDVVELQKAVDEGRYRDMAKTRPVGYDSALSKAQDFLKELKVPMDKLILGGFSQGAMLTTELVMSLEDNCLGAVLLSGTLLDQENWMEQAKNRNGQFFFQSHGSQDPVLSPELAVGLNEILYASGWQGQIINFNGGHEIPPMILERLAIFLRNQTGVPAPKS